MRIVRLMSAFHRDTRSARRRESLIDSAAGIFAGLVAVSLIAGFGLWGLAEHIAPGLDRRSSAELAFDGWSRRSGKSVRWRECHDHAPLLGGMVRCDAGFTVAGRGIVYCPGDQSTETDCRWAQ